MSAVMLDEKAAAALGGASGLTAVTDPTGKTIGFFAGVGSWKDALRLHLLATVTPDSLKDKSRTTEKTYTTAEVKAYLQSLGGGDQ